MIVSLPLLLFLPFVFWIVPNDGFLSSRPFLQRRKLFRVHYTPRSIYLHLLPTNACTPTINARATIARMVPTQKIICNEVDASNNTLTLQEIFACSKSWSQAPLLIRGLFQKEAYQLFTRSNRTSVRSSSPISSSFPWPTWEEVALLATEEDVESRWITHIPNQPRSWKLDIGPFDQEELMDALLVPGESQNSLEDTFCSTLIVNDVDRCIPSLFDWIMDTFPFIPNWRRDDGQISLSHMGGGIGPHIDEYDVFLIQMAGERKWEIGQRFIRIQEECDSSDFLIPNIDVRIIQHWEEEKEKQDVSDFVLYPGDVLYLPPRIAHCGIATSHGCMTLSVGMRAPSVKEIIQKVTEYISSCTGHETIRKRYEDSNLLNSLLTNDGTYISSSRIPRGEISQKAKDEMKALVHSVWMDIINDEQVFDEILGKLLTESKRVRLNYPMALSRSDEDIDTIQSVLDSLLHENGICTLYPAEGISFGYSEFMVDDKSRNGKMILCRLYVDGEMWEVSSDGSQDKTHAVNLIKLIANEKCLNHNTFIVPGQKNHLSVIDSVPEVILSILRDLISKGMLYPVFCTN